MKGVARVLNGKLVDIGNAAVREIVTFSNSLNVNPDHLPYVFWALATKTGLPPMNKKRLQAFTLMVDIMDRTETMPNWKSSMGVPDDITIDPIVDTVADHMGLWAVRVMLPLMLDGYMKALKSQVKAVPKATSGRVPKGNEVEFLRKVFRQILSIKSSMFDRGELLRQVVRVLPI